MTFLWPAMLVLLALIPLGVVLDRAIGRRRLKRIDASGGLGLGRRPVARPSRLRERLPAVLFLAGLAILTVAMARPQSVIDLPREEGTVILAFDVSRSMAADDLKPTRLEAAKTAAKAFVEARPPGVVIGVVAFSGAGLSVQTPTADPAAVIAAIDRLAPERGTSLGQGILAALDTIAKADANPADGFYTNRSPEPSTEPTPVPAGTHGPAVIVLVTDGENTDAPDPLAVAQTAADRGVRIYPIGLGSSAGTTLDLDGFQVHTQLDEPLLRQIADTSGGSYVKVDDAAALKSVYDGLDRRLKIEPEKTELTSVFAGMSVLLLFAGGLCSLVILGRLP